MRALLYAFLIVSLLSFQTTSPIKLAGTSWKGKAMLPDSTSVIVKFTDNLLSFYEVKSSHRLLGTATYEQTNSFISVKTGTGFGPCLKSGNWIYNINVSQNALNFIVIDGPCNMNESALVHNRYLQIVETDTEK